ncbi:MAG: Slam-dependent surface lipoprotein [Asticcacaulis sp.]
MKPSNFKTLAFALLSATALCGGAYANEVGQSSDTSLLVVGESVINSPGGTHTAGRPGVAVLATGLSGIVDFQGLATFAPGDLNGVSTLDYPATVPSDHNSLGVFQFARTSSQDVWYGEFKQTSNIADGTHTVYYVGEDGGNSATPASGTATYTVQGINDYANKGNLAGEFTATFDSSTFGTLTGSVSGGGRTVSIGTAYIFGVNFVGSSGSYTDATNTINGGFVNGKFFGSDADALAGIVSFGNGSNRIYNTAFGGDKQ